MGLIALVAALGVGFYIYRAFVPASDQYAWRQKTTLVVETPEGTQTGASVVQIRARLFKGSTIGGLEVLYGVTGEAAALEVAPGKWLFATIGAPAEAYYWADRSAGMSQYSPELRRAWLPAIRKQDGTVSLMTVQTPDLVTFDDIEDPRTARAVDPQDLEAVFGPGFELKDITLEIVDEPVTDGQLGPLGASIGDYRDKRLDGSVPGSGKTSFAASLSSIDFKRWAK